MCFEELLADVIGLLLQFFLREAVCLLQSCEREDMTRNQCKPKNLSPIDLTNLSCKASICSRCSEIIRSKPGKMDKT